MSVTLTLAPIVSLIGLVVYAITAGKASQAGLVAYGCGLLAFLLNFK